MSHLPLPRMTLPSLLTLALLLGGAQAQIVPAGTQITNQAQVSAQTLDGPVESLSNIVTARVLPVCSVSVLPNGTVQAPGQTASVLAGEKTTLTYQIRNTGNQAQNFPLTIERSGTGGGSVSTLIDTDGNGVPSVADVAAGSVQLGAGETRTVFVQVQTAQAGQLLINLVSSCAGGASPDNNNFALINIGQPPSLVVTKAFDREVLRPGDRTRVTVTLNNRGENASREVTLLDVLSTQLEAGLSLVPGSVRSSAPVEYSADGTTWQAAVPAQPVRALRARQSSLASGETLTLSFELLAGPAAEGRTLTNVAQVISSVAGGAQASDTIEVRYTPGVRIGPAGQPLAEGAADRQERAFALASQEVCFDHTLLNTGDVSDLFRVSVALPAGGAAANIRAADGAALAQPVSLAPGASLPVQVCYTGLNVGAFEAAVTVRGDRGTADRTTDAIGRVETRLPELLKSVSRPGTTWQAGGRVETGQELLYTLRVTNPYAEPLTGLTVTDQLPSGTALLEAPGAQVRGQELSWSLDTLAAGETRELTARVRVTAAEDDQEISNTFELRSPLFPTGLRSNAANAYVWNSAPTITKTALEPEVTIGDRVTYEIVMFNTSERGVLTDVTLSDQPSAGLQYVPGSSRLNGQPFADPAVDTSGGQTALSWNVPDLAPSSSTKLSYQMLVTPDASSELLNTARLRGQGAQGATDIASNAASRSTAVRLLNFAPLGDILGRVFIDTDGNQRPGDKEAGVAGARVLLAGGRSAVTDQQGRYHFGNVALGTHALRLDPYSVQLDPDTAGLTQTVQVRGLTSVNFPLTEDSSGVGRAAEFSGAGLKGQKKVWPVPGGYRVQLTAVAQRSGQLSLRDLVPDTAAVIGGSAEWTGPVQAGTAVQLDYRVTYAGAAAALLGAPQSGWKE